MIFHSGDRKLYDQWINREVELTQVTKPFKCPGEAMFATKLLDRDDIIWFIGINGKRCALFRKEV